MKNTIRELHLRGMEAYDRHDYDEAITLLTELDTVNPRMADVLNRLGIMHSLKGDLHKAVIYLQRSVSLNPAYTEAALNLTITYNDLGETEKAHEVFDRLSEAQNVKEGELDPFAAGKLANEHFRIGNMYLELNRLDDAIEEYQKEGRPAHHILLGAGVVIVEGLDLSGVPPGDYELLCLPLKIKAADGAPARVFLREI
ncbi:hypothetical protein LCGC14_2506530 [marine sediment metagenome]|uniref:Tetratricopeptide repeat protein n=1 Tax=marine sediment metagenome TaxID=412755 RepID=A0A0F9B0D3_9ZZZZ